MAMADQDPNAQNSAEEALLKKAKLQLREGDLHSATATLQDLLSAQPAHREGLYYLAVCMRQSGNNTMAADLLSILINAHPRYGRGYQERGHNFAAMQEAEAATAAFEKAVAPESRPVGELAGPARSLPIPGCRR